MSNSSSTTNRSYNDRDATVVPGPGAPRPWPYDRLPDPERWQQELNSRNPDQAAGAALCLGRLAAAEGRMDDAAVHLTRATESQVPMVVPRAYFQLVAVLQALGREAEAQRALEVAHATSDPAHTADVSVDVAAVLCSRGLEERAIEVLRAVVDGWHPGDATGASDVGDLIRATAALRLGSLFERAGRADAAADAWNLALEANYPAVTPVAALRLAELYLKAEDAYPPRIIEELLRTAIDFDHPVASPQAALLRADFLARHGQLSAARDVYAMLVESDSDLAHEARKRMGELPEPRPVEPAPVPLDMVSILRPILIVGAGTGGRYLLRDLAKERFDVIGFVDDFVGERDINGIPVLGTIDDLDSILAKLRERTAEELYAVLIAIPTMAGARRRVAVEACLRHGIRVENLPSMFELNIRRNLGRQIRDVRVEEVLGDATMEIDRRAGDIVRGRNVLITGAGSTIGRELARQAAHARARLLALTDVSDARLVSVLRELRWHWGFERAVGVVGGVDRQSTILRVLRTHEPEIVFHAASRDHMDLMEENAVETVRTNTLALLDVARACGDAGVQRFVLVGNHDAASLRGIMDTSKLLGEHLLAMVQDEFPFTEYLTVRVGNLYRASNSVVRVFEKQIERGGPVTVLRGARRRFMRIELAAQSVLQLANYGTGGRRYALTGGDTLEIAELADLIVRLRGYRPNEDIEIAMETRRYGERQSIEPLGRHERRAPTDLSEVLEIVGPQPDYDFMSPLVERLREAVDADNPEEVTKLMLETRSLLTAAAPALS